MNNRFKDKLPGWLKRMNERQKQAKKMTFYNVRIMRTTSIIIGVVMLGFVLANAIIFKDEWITKLFAICVLVFVAFYGLSRLVLRFPSLVRLPVKVKPENRELAVARTSLMVIELADFFILGVFLSQLIALDTSAGFFEKNFIALLLPLADLIQYVKDLRTLR